LPEKYNLRLTNAVEGCKKIITVQSKKYITDYSTGVAVTQYYPFDHDDQVSIPDLHKGFKADFYRKLQS
jgi:predicted nucleic-acid-binding Zn-ribbon protein